MISMLYWKIRWKEFKQCYWRNKSRRLFAKYSQLAQFKFHGGFDPEHGWYGEDMLEVGITDVKYYYPVDSKELYKDLKHTLDLELQIRYKDTDS